MCVCAYACVHKEWKVELRGGVDSKALTKNLNFILKVVTFRKILSQSSGMIIFVFRRQPGGSSMEDGWEKAKGEKPDLLAG